MYRLTISVHIVEVFNIAFPIVGALQEAGQLAQRVIGVGAGGGCAVLFAHLARDVAVLVVAVRERNLTRAAGGLGEQIANAVIAVCRCQGAGCSFNPPACRIVGVGGSTPVWNEGFTFNYLDLLNPFDNDTYQSQLRTVYHHIPELPLSHHFEVYQQIRYEL